MKRSPIRRKGISPVSQTKDRIQALLREGVLLRDPDCLLADWTPCAGRRADGSLVYQADHLIERSNSATYADLRLVVRLCKGHHAWKHFKKSNHDRYNQLIKERLSPERVALWERCEQESWRPKRTSATDWLLEEAALKAEVDKLRLTASSVIE